MSKKDFKKGIAAQAKADAAKQEKIAKGLKAHGEILNNISNHQNQIQSALDIVIDDLAESDASSYGLDSTNLPALMDITEKRVLCACIFTLLSTFEQNNEYQQCFYNNLENHLGVSERVSSFDFDNLQRIDSISDRLKMLQVICSFLFLHDESFEFLRDKTRFHWLFALAPVKDIANTCKRIDFEYSMLGVDGIVSRYRIDSSKAEEFDDAEPIAEIANTTEANDDSYEELFSIIHSAIDNEVAFGKSVELSETDFEREIKRDFPCLAYDSLIATNRVGTGYVIFTTFAIYLKQGRKYVEVPYSSILVDKVHTKAGKKAGTRCLVIVYKPDSDIEKSIKIDDGKLIEENLKDLLLKIVNSGCHIAKTDKITELPKLNETLKANILSAILYVLNNDKAQITDAFFFADELGIVSKWNDCYAAIKDEDTYHSIVKECCADIPYPSKRYITTKVIQRAMRCLACSNMLKGLPLSQMNSPFERLIKDFDVYGIDTSRFNKMMDSATDSFLLESPYYTQLRSKYSLSSYEKYADIDLGLDDLIETCTKKQRKRVIGVIAGAAVGGPVGIVAAGVGEKIKDAVKKQKNDKLEKLD